VRLLRREHLEGDRTLEAEVAGLVDDGHPAPPDLALELVMVSNDGDDTVLE
jgi:hypothetical protein